MLTIHRFRSAQYQGCALRAMIQVSVGLRRPSVRILLPIQRLNNALGWHCSIGHQEPSHLFKRVKSQAVLRVAHAFEPKSLYLEPIIADTDILLETRIRRVFEFIFFPPPFAAFVLPPKDRVA